MITASRVVHFRKPRVGPESLLVKELLLSYDTLLFERTDYVLALIEPRVGAGYPDILIATVNESRTCPRPPFDLKDLQLLHFLSVIDGPVETSFITHTIGIKSSLLDARLARLAGIGAVEVSANRVITSRTDELFLLDGIIAIEAKIRNWKEAVQQARLNELFASESYVAVPEARLKRIVEQTDLSDSVGFVSHSEGGIQLRKRSKRHPLPQSVYSWVVNELVCRELGLSTLAG